MYLLSSLRIMTSNITPLCSWCLCCYMLIAMISSGWNIVKNLFFFGIIGRHAAYSKRKLKLDSFYLNINVINHSQIPNLKGLLTLQSLPPCFVPLCFPSSHNFFLLVVDKRWADKICFLKKSKIIASSGSLASRTWLCESNSTQTCWLSIVLCF